MPLLSVIVPFLCKADGIAALGRHSLQNAHEFAHERADGAAVPLRLRQHVGMVELSFRNGLPPYW